MPLLTLTAAQADVVTSALADAEQHRQDFNMRCHDCAASPDMRCPGHLADFRRAQTYRQLRDVIAQASCTSRRPATGANPAAGR